MRRTSKLIEAMGNAFSATIGVSMAAPSDCEICLTKGVTKGDKCTISGHRCIARSQLNPSEYGWEVVREINVRMGVWE